MSEPEDGPGDDHDGRSGSDSESSADDVPELMVHGRDKRVTAGNKLQSLLSGQADLEADEIFIEAEDDVEFDSNEENDDDEMDESSQEDESAEAEDAGEQELRRQQDVDRQAQRKKRSAAQVFAQPRQPAIPKLPKPTPKRDRRSMSKLPEATRRSSRMHAVQTAEDVENKLQEAERRRSQMTVKIRPKEREMTQEERMAESKETEERNRSSLRQIFELEEQRKARQRKQAEKRKMHGPMVRWMSRASFIDDTKAAQNFVILEAFDANVTARRVFFDSADESPVAKRRLVCPITGARAKYRDPKTGIGYVTREDFSHLRNLANGKYRWSSLGFAVDAGSDRVMAKGAPPGF